MKDKKYSPYATMGFEKIESPKPKKKDEVKASKIVGKGDLRTKGK